MKNYRIIYKGVCEMKKRMKQIVTGVAIGLVLVMIMITVVTNLPQSEPKPTGKFAEYENVNIDQLPENRVDTSLDLDAGLEVGQKAPNFTLTSLDGEKFSLADYKGEKMVMLNFWASWCPPCRVEMPEMEKYYEQYQEQDNIEILAVNMTTIERGSQDKVPQFVEELGLTFPVLMDQDGNVKDLYDVMVYPTTYIVNEEGIITDKVVIPLDVEVIKWLVEKSKDA